LNREEIDLILKGKKLPPLNNNRQHNGQANSEPAAEARTKEKKSTSPRSKKSTGTSKSKTGKTGTSSKKKGTGTGSRGE
jgi:hypothetical protein